jgi:hypothetical protein
MKAKYNPNKNLEARSIRQLIGTREFVTAREICDEFDLILPDLSEIMLRLEEYQLITTGDWPLSPASEIFPYKHDLIAGKEYDVLLVESGSYTILSEGADPRPEPGPYQFHRELFELSNRTIPNGWVIEWFDGELILHPSIWKRFFFSDYHEGSQRAREQFVEGLKSHFPETYQRWLTYQSNDSKT